MTTARLGRALGPGNLQKVRRGRGAALWTLTWTDAVGTRHRQALSSDHRVAQLKANDIIHQRDMQALGLGAVDGQNTLLAELRDAYLADLRTRATAAHVVNSKNSLRRMLGELRAERVRDLRPYEVLQARARLLDAGLAPRTSNLHVDRLSAMLTWAVGAGLIAVNPIARIKRLPDSEAYQRCRRRALSDDEIARFLGAAEADDRENQERVADEAEHGGRRTLRHRGVRVPQAPFWMFVLETACRYGEARTLAWSDVDLHDCTVTLRAENTKARRARCVPIRRDFAAVLAELRAVQVRGLGREPEASERVFLSPERQPLPVATVNAMRVFDRLLVAAGIERVDGQGRKVDIHALRHSAASRFARAGVPLIQAQRILGHSDPKLTARVYTHLDAEDLRDAIEMAAGQGAPPRPRLVRGETPSHAEATA